MQETRELTFEELDQELAEQLPARDLMCCYNPCSHPCAPPPCQPCQPCAPTISVCASVNL
jgi:hypothetical protein